MIKALRFKTRWLYHPVTIFLFIQILWILLMVIWIRWYVEKHSQLRQMAERLRTQVDIVGFDWIPLLEGGLLLALILAGATGIFLYWIKQHRLNEMQRGFVSSVTHELKSPVASIQLALETMAMRDLPEDRKQEYIRMMLDDTERLNALIDRILGAARIEKKRSRYEMETVSMRHFLNEIIEKDRHLFEKDGREIVLEKGRDSRVTVDRAAMRIVLHNLLENAARYSPAGARILLRLYRELRSCRLDVIDSGCGIAGKDLKNIFKMFWRSAEAPNSRVRGTGLGLYIVQSIVNDHHGKAWASSPGIGRGAVFSIRLPRVRKYWNLAERRREAGGGQ